MTLEQHGGEEHQHPPTAGKNSHGNCDFPKTLLVNSLLLTLSLTNNKTAK